MEILSIDQEFCSPDIQILLKAVGVHPGQATKLTVEFFFLNSLLGYLVLKVISGPKL